MNHPDAQWVARLRVGQCVQMMELMEEDGGGTRPVWRGKVVARSQKPPHYLYVRKGQKGACRTAFNRSGWMVGSRRFYLAPAQFPWETT